MNFHDALNLILLLCGLFILNRIVSGDNPLEWWHLVSTRSADGKIYFDNDKIGQMTGLVFSTWVVSYITLTVKILDGYYVACVAIWLIYCAGMTAFGKWARAVVADRFSKAPQRPEPEAPSTVTTTTTKTTP